MLNICMLLQTIYRGFNPRTSSTIERYIFYRVNKIASWKGCTPSQLALAWVHHQGNDVCSIPGTTKIENFDQNVGALSVKLTPEEMAELESLASAGAVKGDRYDGNVSTWKDSETPPLSSWKPEWRLARIIPCLWCVLDYVLIFFMFLRSNKFCEARIKMSLLFFRNLKCDYVRFTCKFYIMLRNATGKKRVNLLLE